MSGQDEWLVSGSRKDPIEESYTIMQELGRGKFSIVKEGIRLSDKEHVAIKIVKKGQFEDMQVEVDILRMIHHPHIANLREVFETRRTLYLVLDLVTGGELFDKIVDLEHYTEEDARSLTFNLVSVLKILHEKSIVHRDLKPENLLLMSRTDPITQIKVADFGLAALLSMDGLLKDAVGTPGYMAPEVIRYKGYRDKVDMWSTGVILYILLCGYPPYEDDDMTFSYKFHSPEWDAVSNEAKDLIRKLLQIDPSKRLSAQGALEHEWLAKERKNAKHMDHTVSQLKKFNARRRLKRGILAVASITRMQRMMGSGKLAAAALISKEEQSPDQQKTEDEAEQSQLVHEYLKTVNNVLLENVELLKNVSSKAPKMFNDIRSTHQEEEVADTLGELFENVSKIEAQLNLFKISYLKEFTKGRDYSKYFVQ